jgi:hypothetical protein
MSRLAQVEYAAITSKVHRSDSTVKHDKFGKVNETGKEKSCNILQTRAKSSIDHGIKKTTELEFTQNIEAIRSKETKIVLGMYIFDLRLGNSLSRGAGC